MTDDEPMDVLDGWVERSIGVVGISLPGDWEVISDGGETMVIGHQGAPAGVFSPNTVIRQTPTDPSLTSLASNAIATTIVAFEGSHFIANDIAELDSHPARAQVFTYDAGGFSIVVDRRLAVVGNLGIEITTSFTVGQSERRSHFRATARSSPRPSCNSYWTTETARSWESSSFSGWESCVPNSSMRDSWNPTAN